MNELGIKGDNILCVGAIDDSEVLFFEDNGYNAIGIDLLDTTNKVMQCDMSRIYEHNYFKGQRYDIVMANESLEHCYDFEGFMKGLNLVCSKYFICMGPTLLKLKKEGAPNQWDCNVLDFMLYEKEEDKDKYKNSLLDCFKEFGIIINEIHKEGDRLFFILKKKEI